VGREVTPQLPAGVRLEARREIRDPRGAVLHMLRVDAPEFTAFGEIYFSEILPGFVKAWKRHQRQTPHLIVPIGRVEFVIADDRPGSPTHGLISRLILGRPDHYELLVIPPMLWYGWRTIGETSALIANCADLTHDPTESEIADQPGTLGPFAW